MRSTDLRRAPTLLRWLGVVVGAATPAAGACGHWTPGARWTTVEQPGREQAAPRAHRTLTADDCAKLCREPAVACGWATLAIPVLPPPPPTPRTPPKPDVECRCNYEGTGKPAGTYTRVAPESVADEAEVGREVPLPRGLCDSICSPVVGNIVYAGGCSLSALPTPVAPLPPPPPPPAPDEEFVVCQHERGGSYDLVGPLPSGRVVGLAARFDRPVRSAVEHLARAAHLEAASVAEFRRLGVELRAHGAPARFVVAARRAARDEIVHARLMRGLTRGRGGRGRTDTNRIERIERTARPAQQRPRLVPRVGAALVPWIDLAIENATAGCIGETIGTALALHQASHAASAQVREVSRRVARDEARHAALAWRLHDWFGARLTADERRRVQAAMVGALDGWTRTGATEPPPWARALGWPEGGWFERVAEQLRPRVTGRSRR